MTEARLGYYLRNAAEFGQRAAIGMNFLRFGITGVAFAAPDGAIATYVAQAAYDAPENARLAAHYALLCPSQIESVAQTPPDLPAPKDLWQVIYDAAANEGSILHDDTVSAIERAVATEMERLATPPALLITDGPATGWRFPDCPLRQCADRSVCESSTQRGCIHVP